MENLPFYIPALFILTTLLTMGLLFKASDYTKPLIILVVFWLGLQALAGLSGFYKVTNGIPPRFALLLMPPMVFILILFISTKGKKLVDSFDVKTLTLLHIVRIPVELTLYWLFLHKQVPQLMTFEGRNFDIICGLTAPLIYYFGYQKNLLSKGLILVWNILCLLLLLNIAVTAVLSAPFVFQKFAFDQPNIALFYFPFVWLPCFVVPAVLFAHLVSLKRLFALQSNN